jgi:hypothetical protein
MFLTPGRYVCVNTLVSEMFVMCELYQCVRDVNDVFVMCDVNAFVIYMFM